MTPLAPLPRERAKRIVYIGTPEIAVAPLQTLVAEGFVIELVVTGVDKRRGRGTETSANPVKAAALALGIPVSHDINDVLKLNPDGLLGVVVAFGNIIAPEILQHVPMINIHYSALPRWRGAAPVERAILSGDSTTAVCIIQVVEQLDAGDVLATAPCAIGDDDSVVALRGRLGQLALPLLIDICSNGVSSQQAQTGEVVVARKITAHDLAIDWSSIPVAISRQVRLGNAFTFFDGKRFKVHEVSSASEQLPAGSISVHDARVLVGARGGSIQLVTVQPEGKPRTSASEWARGARLSTTSVFSDR
ncbi:MAG: methionyl-tRNA formyltransferase [Actinomycetota bacterium]